MKKYDADIREACRCCGNCFHNDGGLCPAKYPDIDEPLPVEDDAGPCQAWTPTY